MMDKIFGSMSNIWIQMQNYAVLVPYIFKELDRKYNAMTQIRKLRENDEDLPQSLKGKVCIITGGTRGIGAEVVKSLLRKDCHVITGSTSKSEEEMNKKYKKLLEGVPSGKGKLEIWHLDLFSMSSVKQFVDKFKTSKLPLNYLIANAGIMLKPYSISDDGFESHYAINYLSHCLLIFHLLPTLVETARQQNSCESRIVMTSSAAHLAANLQFNDLQLKTHYSPYLAYGQSKLAQIMFTYKLSDWLKSKSDWGQLVKVHALHPGICNTDIISHLQGVKEMAQFANNAVRTPKEGAETVLFATLSSQLNGLSGKYLEDSAIFRSSSMSYIKPDQDKLFDITFKSLSQWMDNKTIDEIFL